MYLYVLFFDMRSAFFFLSSHILLCEFFGWLVMARTIFFFLMDLFCFWDYWVDLKICM